MEETLTEHGRGCVTYILGDITMVKTTLRVLRISRYTITLKKNVTFNNPFALNALTVTKVTFF